MLLNFLSNLDRNVFKPFAIIPTQGNLSVELGKRNVEWQQININIQASKKNFLKFGFILFKVIRYLVTKKIDIVHVNNLKSYRIVSIASLFLRKKTICHIHFPPTPESLKYEFKIRRPDCIICCCEDIQKDISKIIPPRFRPRVIESVQNGIQLEALKNDNEISALKVGLGLRPHKFVVTIIGDLSERKGQKYFIEMAKNISQRFPYSIFLIIGGERIAENVGYQKKLEDYARNIGIAEKIKFLGSINNVSDYLWATDILVLPSFAEGLPLVILEAMACAKPVVASNVNGIPEAVEDNITGLLVNPGDAAALTDSVSKLLSNETLRKDMGKAARMRAETLFGIGSYANRMQKIYSNILKCESYL